MLMNVSRAPRFRRLSLALIAAVGVLAAIVGQTRTYALAGQAAAGRTASAKGRSVVYSSVGPELTIWDLDVDAVTLTKRTTMKLPGLITEAHRRAEGASDNISVVAMTWVSQDDPSVADTQALGDEFTTSTNTTQPLDVAVPADDVTEEDIERAIAEIQSAIRKVPR